MKYLFGLIAAVLLTGCGGKEKTTEETNLDTTEVSEGEVANLSPEATLGQEIFDGKGNCFTCHKPDAQAIGPSIREIAKIYKLQNADMVTFLKGNGKPIVKPEQYEVMKTNFYLTKTFTDEELKAVEAYVYSFE